MKKTKNSLWWKKHITPNNTMVKLYEDPEIQKGDRFVTKCRTK
jgi:hypothetical protein